MLYIHWYYCTERPHPERFLVNPEQVHRASKFSLENTHSFALSFIQNGISKNKYFELLLLNQHYIGTLPKYMRHQKLLIEAIGKIHRHFLDKR